MLISEITIDEELQPRAEIDNETYLEYKSLLESGTKFPPVLIVSDGSTNWLVDGYHRYYSHKSMDYTEIDAEILEGDRKRALLLSLAANATHGKRRVSGDYKRAYEIAVRSQLVEADDTNSVAKILFCTTRGANELTREAREQSEIELDTRIQELRAAGMTLREIAADVGVSPMTVQRTVSKEKASDLVQADPPRPTPSPNTFPWIEPDPETPSLDPAHNHRAQGTGENEWYTPVRYIDAAYAVLGEIDLDPASTEIANKTVAAKSIFTGDDDGLQQDWFGRVWLNPPYAQPFIMQFAEKMVRELVAGRVTEAIMLTHNYTDTAWFHLLWSKSTAVCFTRGRVGFLSPTGEKAAPTQGQAFFYFGKNKAGFAKEFASIGAIGTRYGGWFDG